MIVAVARQAGRLARAAARRAREAQARRHRQARDLPRQRADGRVELVLGAPAARSSLTITTGGRPSLTLPLRRWSRTAPQTRAASSSRRSCSSEDEELWADDDDADHAGWFCVRTDPFPCPAAGCTFVADFMTAAHLVLVWEERDDPNLLWHAQRANGGRPQPAHRRVRAGLRPERLVLRLGGRRPARPRRSWQ